MKWRQTDRYPSVAEGGEITYTITLTNKDGLPINNHAELFFKLTDGTNIVVAANSTTGSATVIAPDNVYVGTNAPVVNAIDSVSGQDAWKFEQLTWTRPRSAPRSPTSWYPGNEGDIVKVTIKLTSGRQTDRYPIGGRRREITYTITLTNKDGLPINNHAELFFKLTDGTNIVVAANSTTGSATVIAPDNVYVGTNAPVVNAIDSVSARMRGSSSN
uniref:LapA adhesin domain-containing protein n=1 Tax=Ditylenchus dipsaci TaxID=166011 RepID=A0A915DS22_9BILA